jgi:hypothetical protein
MRAQEATFVSTNTAIKSYQASFPGDEAAIVDFKSANVSSKLSPVIHKTAIQG